MADTKNNNSNENQQQNNNGNSQFSFNMNDIKNQQALFQHEQNMYNSTKEPANGTFDKFGEARLRVAIIENYTLDNNNPQDSTDKTDKDPLNIEKVINMKNGNVVIRWVDFKGGVIRPENFSYPNDGYTEPWTYFPDKDSKYPELRTLDCYNHDKASDREMLSLSHAFIWSNESNWCGMNYLPPVGSVVIVGFKKNNIPVIVGYLPNNYESFKPYLKPGETMIKGYGNNYIHWRWSNKLDLHASSKKGMVDVDDPYKQDVYPNDMEMWIRFDPFTRNIVIDVDQKDSGNAKHTWVEIKPENVSLVSRDIDNNKRSNVIVSNSDIYACSSDENYQTSIYLNSTNVKIDTDGDINIKAKGTINLTASQINLN